MPRSARPLTRLCIPLLVTVVAALVPACAQRYLVGIDDDIDVYYDGGDRPDQNGGDAVDPPPDSTTPPGPPQPPLAAKVDILLVIDDSGSMAQQQLRMGQSLDRLLGALRDGTGQPLDYRIAVTSTNVGVGGVQVDSSDFRLCNHPDRGGTDQDKGKLLNRVRFAEADWERSNAGLFACGDPAIGLPVGNAELCATLKESRQWLIDNCQDVEATFKKNPGWLANGPDWPQPDAEVARRLRCISQLGVNGCFIEQPLEAARAALDVNRASFVRPDALLAVLFLTDENDCSLSNPSLVDPNSNAFLSQTDVGFRCYRDAQICSGEKVIRTVGSGGEPVTYHAYDSCRDNHRWVIPVDDYIAFFTDDIKGSNAASRVMMAAISGNPDYSQALAVPEGPGPQPASVKFVWESHDAGLAGTVDFQTTSCRGSGDGGVAVSATPATRIRPLLNAFPDPATGAPLWSSICDDSFGLALENLGRAIAVRLASVP